MSNPWTYNALIRPSNDLPRAALRFLLDAFQKRGYVPMHPEKGVVEVSDHQGEYGTASDFDAAIDLIPSGGMILLNHGLEWDVGVRFSPADANPGAAGIYTTAGVWVYGGFLRHRDSESEQIAADAESCVLKLCERFEARFGYALDEITMEDAWWRTLEVEREVFQNTIPSRLAWFNYIPDSLADDGAIEFLVNAGAGQRRLAMQRW